MEHLWNILQLDQVVLSDLTIDLEVRAVLRTPPETEGGEGVTEEIVLQRLGQFHLVSIIFYPTLSNFVALSASDVTRARRLSCGVLLRARNARGVTVVGTLDASCDRTERHLEGKTCGHKYESWVF